MVSQFALMQAVLAVTAVARNKVVAYRLGPAGFGEIAQISLVTTTLGTLVAFGLSVGLSRNAATARSIEQRQRQLASANVIVLSLSVLACMGCALLLAGGRLLPLVGLVPSRPAALAAAIFLLAIPVDALRSNYAALLQGILDVKGLTVRRSAAVVIATALAVPIVWWLGFVGAALQFLLLTALTAALLGVRCRALGYSPLSARFDRGTALQLAAFGVVSLASSFAQSFADAAVRSSLIVTAGLTANGLLQSAHLLAFTVRNVVLTSIGSISLATVAAQSDRQEISATLNRLLSVVIPVATSALGLLGMLGAHAVSLLYAGSFAPAAALFPFLLSADVFTTTAWVLGSPLLAFGDRKLWLCLELIYASARWAIAIVLIPRYGATAVVVGYFAAGAVHAGLNYAVYRARYKLTIDPVHLARMVAGAAFVAGLAYVGSRPASRAAFGAAVIAWTAYTGLHLRRAHVLTSVRRKLRGDPPDQERAT